MNNRVPQILSRYRMHLSMVAANAVFAAIFLSVALSWFHQPAPHDIRVGVVAPSQVAQTIRDGLREHRPGAFDVRLLAGDRQARAAIARRDVDGALLVSARGMTLLTAGAGGTAPEQAITAAFTVLAAKQGRALAVIDVVPPARGDSLGLSAYFLILCVLFPSLGTGVAAGRLLRRAPLASRLAVLFGFAAVSGLTAAAIADGISGLGHFWAIAGTIALFSLAVSAPTAALAQIKAPLVALSVFAFVILGIPVSGGPANFAAFGPGFLRWLSQVLPLGVATAAVRNTVYFHAADTAGHLWVLGGFAVAGTALLVLLTTAARRAGAPASTSTPDRTGDSAGTALMGGRISRVAVDA